MTIRFETFKPEVVRQAIEQLGEHKGGCGIVCDRHCNWSEQSYEFGAVRTVEPDKGRKYWIVWKDGAA